MVRINDALKDPTCDLWYIGGEKPEYIGTIRNAIQFADIRLQIKGEQTSKNLYMVYYNKQEIRIDRNGKLESWPKGLYDQVTDLLIQLI